MKPLKQLTVRLVTYISFDLASTLLISCFSPLSVVNKSLISSLYISTKFASIL